MLWDSLLPWECLWNDCILTYHVCTSPFYRETIISMQSVSAYSWFSTLINGHPGKRALQAFGNRTMNEKTAIEQMDLEKGLTIDEMTSLCIQMFGKHTSPLNPVYCLWNRWRKGKCLIFIHIGLMVRICRVTLWKQKSKMKVLSNESRKMQMIHVSSHCYTNYIF